MPESKIQLGLLDNATSGMTLIGEETGINASDVTFDNIPTIYNRLEIYGERSIYSNDDNQLLMLFDYGSGAIVTGYTSTVRSTNNVGNTFDNENGATSSIQLIGTTTSTWGIGNLTDEGILGVNISIFDVACGSVGRTSVMLPRSSYIEPG